MGQLVRHYFNAELVQEKMYLSLELRVELLASINIFLVGHQQAASLIFPAIPLRIAPGQYVGVHAFLVIPNIDFQIVIAILMAVVNRQLERTGQVRLILAIAIMVTHLPAFPNASSGWEACLRF